MSIALEKRLRKLEQTFEPPKEQPSFDRKALEELRSTPEGRAIARRKTEEILREMRTKERARIEAMTPPERLGGLRKQWAEEDSRLQRMATYG